MTNLTHTLRSLLRASSLLLLLPLFTSVGCKRKVVEVSAATVIADPNVIEVKPALTSNLKLGTASMHDVKGLLQVSAHVETDASRIARVGSPVAGRILKLLFFEGQGVPPGAGLPT